MLFTLRVSLVEQGDVVFLWETQVDGECASNRAARWSFKTRPDLRVQPLSKQPPAYPQLTHFTLSSPPNTMLPTIYQWSVEHIRRVFEAKSEDECRRAIHDTFSHDIDFITNGKQLTNLDLQRFILSMVAGSGYRLQVQWQNALEVPRDESNRVSAGSTPK